jgi:hypothetical protein
MTLLCVVLAIFPIIEVPDSLTFTLKLSGTVVASNARAALIHWFRTRRGLARQASRAG